SAKDWYPRRIPEEDHANSIRQTIALRRAMDLLAARPEGDKARLGFVGHDYGGGGGNVLGGGGPRRRDPARAARCRRPPPPGLLLPAAEVEGGLPAGERDARAHGLSPPDQEREHALPVRDERRVRVAGRHLGRPGGGLREEGAEVLRGRPRHGGAAGRPGSRGLAGP